MSDSARLLEEARRQSGELRRYGQVWPPGTLPHEAANALDALAAELQRLREALEAIVAVRLDTTPGVTTERAIAKARVEMRELARAALAGSTAAQHSSPGTKEDTDG